MKSIAIVTGSRAEYGLFRPLAQKIAEAKAFELLFFVTGTHVSPQFGMTCKEIIEDGFTISDSVEMLLSSDTDCGVTKSLGLGIIGFADAFRRCRPDLLIVLGDRFETFAAVQAAYLAKIPIAHLHGGELTAGAIDDGIRHSITKMSQYHFTSSEVYRQRVIRLGENPERVFNVGAIGLDNLNLIKLMKRSELERELGLKLKERFAVVTFHPTTLENKSAEGQCRNLLEALDHFPDLSLLFTKSNADMGGQIIATLIDEYASKNQDRSVVVTSLGTKRYFSAISHADVVIGNSSSGIYEVPSFGIPTVNIGDRQRGRLRAESVIDCDTSAEAICGAIEQALSHPFRSRAKSVVNPFGDGHAADKILRVIQSVMEKEINLKKEFYDG